MPYAVQRFTNSGSSWTTYYYILNPQGDVMALLNNSGSIAAKYSYSAWGKVLSVTDANGNAITSSTHIANANPIRYRGYYYDTDTQFYYLQSRYYDPDVGRFINADSYASTGQGIVGFNMFAYCNDDPINHLDKDGHNTAALAYGWTGSAWWLTLVDGPLPIGDLIYGFGIIIFSSLVIESSLNNIKQNTDESSNDAGDAELPKAPEVEYPGDDPTKAPDGTEWRGAGEQGSSKGNYYNPNTGESWHPDLNHPAPIGGHWDYNYKGSGTSGWRVFPNGNVVPKFAM